MGHRPAPPPTPSRKGRGRNVPWIHAKAAPHPTRCWQTAQQGTRGRLKMFLGAAPGVGKTYEMLSAAQARHREGADVVVGVVETHGRRETEALLDGLEVMPRREVEYRGRTLARDGPRRAAGAPPAARPGR